MAFYDVGAVDAVKGYLDEMLAAAGAIPRTDAIEPAIQKSDIAPVIQNFCDAQILEANHDDKKSLRNAIIETVVRDAFVALLATCTISQPKFVQVWNLLDVVNILADGEQCDSALQFWLVEELLDSQTIAGCRKVFDYLESRRERMHAKKDRGKNIVILRTCNELLRRLSRAEDTAFCGRVFIYMFQSTPLGDKSSVNLRGEYHVENVTTYDQTPASANNGDEMEVDTEVKATPTGPAADAKETPVNSDEKITSKAVSFSGKQSAGDAEMVTADELYPTFWSLQQYFSQPKQLFERTNFDQFKKAFEATLSFFKPYHLTHAPKLSSTPEHSSGAFASVDSQIGKKRKREAGFVDGEQGDDDFANTYNPKYLTSKDLFELEIKDTTFRRNVMVQALIIMEFLSSLSAKAKEKSKGIVKPNASVMYTDQVLAEDDVAWVLHSRDAIISYLKKDHDGPFFARAVEATLSRDKNWVYWKQETCPPISRPAIKASDYLAAKATLKRVTKKRNMPKTPMGALDLTFLSKADAIEDMEHLKKPERYQLPDLLSFKKKIADDDFEIGMPTNDESKKMALQSKESKKWRALRIAKLSKMVLFDKLSDLDNIDIIFKEPEVEPEVEEELEKARGGEKEAEKEHKNGEAAKEGEQRASENSKSISMAKDTADGAAGEKPTQKEIIELFEEVIATKEGKQVADAVIESAGEIAIAVPKEAKTAGDVTMDDVSNA